MRIVFGLNWGGINADVIASESELLLFRDFARAARERRRQAGEWIPVSRSLPDHAIPVLVCCDAPHALIAARSPHGWWRVVSDERGIIHDVTHWQPLPEKAE